MTTYQGIVKSATGFDDVVHCDRLDEFFKEFIEYRKWKSTTKQFNKDTFPFYNKWKKYAEDGYPKIIYIDLNFDNTWENKNPVVYWERPLGWETSFDYSTGWDLGINIEALKKKTYLNSDKWRQEKEKIEKVLKDIWTTGEIKDTYGLDLNWPANQQTSEQTEENKANPKPKSSDKKDKNFVELEKQNQELRTKNKQLKKEKKVYWIGGSFAFLALVGLIVWLVLRKKNK